MLRPSDEGRSAEEVRSRTAPVRPGALTKLIEDLLRLPARAGWETPPAPGEILGRFEIVRELGRGGFGVVYEALDRGLGRSVALKAVRAPPGSGETKGLAEAEAAARLAHPNIVHLYDVGRSERGAFLIMELLRGETLSTRLARGALLLRQAVGVAVEIARGLAHAHQQGVIHRDLKPGNVFLCDDGQVKVLDFGLAQVFGRAGPAGGTADYTAPEQARGEPGDERADVYSLGVVLAELTTGKRGEDGTRRSARTGALAALRRLVHEMLSRDPAERPASAGEVLARLLRIQRALEPRRWLWAGWGLAVLALAVAAAFAVRGRPLPPGRLIVALADTDNQTGEPDLDGVAELLQAGLGQSRRISILPRSALLNQLREAGQAVPPTIGESQARLAATRGGARFLALPAVRRTGAGYEASLHLVDLASGRVQLSAREPAGAKVTLPAALERLVMRVRRALAERPEQALRAPVGLAEVAPARPEALGPYAEGRRLASSGRFLDALAAFRKAIDTDPEFLLPRVGALEIYWSQVKGVLLEDVDRFFSERDQGDNLAILRRELERIPRGDRLFVEYILQVNDAGSLAEEVAAADRAIEAAPDDPRYPIHAAWELLWQRADVLAARPYIERALALASIPPEHAVQFLLYLRRPEEALARAQRWVAEAPSAGAWYWLSEVYRQRGELGPGLEAARRSAALPGGRFNAELFVDADAIEEGDALQARDLRGRFEGLAIRGQLDWLNLRGRPREAVARVEQTRPGPDADWYTRVLFHALMANAYFPTGDREAVVREMHEMMESGDSAFMCEAWTLAAMGDLDRAASLATYAVTDYLQVCTGMTRALVRWKRGDVDGALSILAHYPIGTSDFYRGEILAEQGRDQEAVEALRRYRPRRGLNFYESFQDRWNYPRSLYLEARSLARLDRREEARRCLARLLHLWDHAEPGLPLLAQAKSLEAELMNGRVRP